jgi:hypothetical protein
MKAIQIETFAAGQLHFQEANDTWLLASLLVSVSQAGRNHRNVRSFGAPDRRRRDRDAARVATTYRFDQVSEAITRAAQSAGKVLFTPNT